MASSKQQFEIPLAEVGSVSIFGGSSPPANWLLCNGSAVSRTTYANLFNVIGTLYGIGDGATTFNLPDFRDRFPKGKNADSLGAVGGTADGNHSHSTPGHQHQTGYKDGNARLFLYNSAGVSITLLTDFNWSTGGTSGADRSNVGGTNVFLHTFPNQGGGTSGGASATENRPPYQAVNYIIKY